MTAEELLKQLADKDDKAAYAFAKEIGVQSAESSKYYCFFDAFVSLLNAGSSYVRTRGVFCAVRRHDGTGRESCGRRCMIC